MSDSPIFEETLLKWEEPIEVTADYKIKMYIDISNPLARKKNPLPPLDKNIPRDEILNGMFPVRVFEKDGKKFVQFVSAEDTKREMLKYLEKELENKMKERQARVSGLDPVRLELHFQLFDELMRQVTVNSPERGLLLLKVRDDFKMTIAAYQSLYESSVLFGINKQIQAEEGKADLEKRIQELERQKEILTNKKIDLTNKLESTKKSFDEINSYDKKRREKEKNFLQYQSQHLEAILKQFKSNILFRV